MFLLYIGLFHTFVHNIWQLYSQTHMQQKVMAAFLGKLPKFHAIHMGRGSNLHSYITLNFWSFCKQPQNSKIPIISPCTYNQGLIIRGLFANEIWDLHVYFRVGGLIFCEISCKWGFPLSIWCWAYYWNLFTTEKSAVMEGTKQGARTKNKWHREQEVPVNQVS